MLTWSPQGRLHQIEYALEAVKQGGAVVGCKNATTVVLVTLNRELPNQSKQQKKIFKIDNNIGIAVSGLASDAVLLTEQLRAECTKSKFIYGSSPPLSQLADTISRKLQGQTQRSSRRPYGVGLILAGLDNSGTSIFHVCPSGNLYEYDCFALGSRSQASKTYLEKYIDTLKECSRVELIKHAIKALGEAQQANENISTSNCSIAVAYENKEFAVLDESEADYYMNLLDETK